MYMQNRIRELVESDPAIEVVGCARNGVEAIEKATTLDPDVITMDLFMPKMGGVDAIAEIMKKHPKPIIVFSSYTRTLGVDTFRALDLGAVDVIEKPSGSVSLDIEHLKDELLEKILVAARVKVIRNLERSEEARSGRTRAKLETEPPRRVGGVQPSRSDLKKLVCIGGSTGAPQVLAKALRDLPEDFPAPIVIAQHMPPRFTNSFAEQLNRDCQLCVKEGESGERVRAGWAYVAPGDSHLRVTEDLRVRLEKATCRSRPRPSVDALFESAAAGFGCGVCAVVLSGMGSDGSIGVEAVAASGGEVLVQNEESCAVYGMPRAAMETGLVNGVVSPNDLSVELLRAVGKAS